MNQSRLVFIKSFHTAVFMLMSVCILYILYCGLTRTYHWTLAVALVLVVVESLVFLGNGRRCPLTKMAQDAGAASGENWVADIFLPGWFIPYVTPVCTGLFIAGLVALLLNIVLRLS